jgi:hypothetical protein
MSCARLRALRRPASPATLSPASLALDRSGWRQQFRRRQGRLCPARAGRSSARSPEAAPKRDRRDRPTLLRCSQSTLPGRARVALGLSLSLSLSLQEWKTGQDLPRRLDLDLGVQATGSAQPDSRPWQALLPAHCPSLYPQWFYPDCLRSQHSLALEYPKRTDTAKPPKRSLPELPSAQPASQQQFAPAQRPGCPA